jgi:uncharacterized protein (TIGR03067 family)
MCGTAVLFAALALGAPGLKDPPAKPNPLVGEWVQVSVSFRGKTYADTDLRYEFTADGKWLTHVRHEKSPGESQYTIDPEADPPAIDLKTRTNWPSTQGIFKIDGDTLTIALPQDRRTVRPTDFETPKDSKVAVFVFKRVK